MAKLSITLRRLLVLSAAALLAAGVTTAPAYAKTWYPCHAKNRICSWTEGGFGGKSAESLLLRSCLAPFGWKYRSVDNTTSHLVYMWKNSKCKGSPDYVLKPDSKYSSMSGYFRSFRRA
ncbi:peptidase inhibitor family I36 protein [Streptomyces sp. NPDC048611]|uniref:peptidase inhibitor family I36 protein n=1 Tax=Streptomyces sp. NPDC048611 TaxID=3155635 RepID=UPI00343F896C